MNFKVVYLENIIIDDTKGKTEFIAIDKMLQVNKIDIKKVFCLGIDGSRNMVSHNVGVASYSES